MWSYKWIAVQLDGAHTAWQAEGDNLRDQFEQEQHYEVLSLKPSEKGYLEEARRLVEKMEEWMSLAETDPWAVAVQAKVTKSVVHETDDIPF